MIRKGLLLHPGRVLLFVWVGTLFVLELCDSGLEYLTVCVQRLDGDVASVRRCRNGSLEPGTVHGGVFRGTGLVVAGQQPPLLGLGRRSEEHTSELQSRGQLVCRILL